MGRGIVTGAHRPDLLDGVSLPGRSLEPGRETPDLEDELWATRHIAHFLHCGRSSVFVTVADRGFPTALAVRTGGRRPRRLWVAAEVRAWAKTRPRVPGAGSAPEARPKVADA